MAVAPGGYVDHWYVFARREWPDGMQLEACSNSTISYTDDGGMVVDLVDDDGNGAIFVVDPDAAYHIQRTTGSGGGGIASLSEPVIVAFCQKQRQHLFCR